ncbi:unnamed protein product [Polarella glacialis]|uniref:C3H1-type domain-containing protein n=1 Tax=Polarella glacialis TaxID=89957 RepID=A0A813DIJ3_POLGL|nr:unnamed protein product [Polarella glacialis]
MCSSTCRFEEADETDLPFVRSPEAAAERRSLISSLNIEPSFLCYAVEAPPGFENVAPPAVKAPQTWSTEEPRSLPLAPPGARFLTTWPSARLSTIAEEVQLQIMTNNNNNNWSLEQSRVQRPSSRHNRGECKPCAFFTTDRSCHSGVDCLFCHLCQPDETKARKQSLRQQSRRRRHRAGATVFLQPQPTTDST